MEHLTFPFGQSVKRVIQADRSPKSVFILALTGALFTRAGATRREKR